MRLSKETVISPILGRELSLIKSKILLRGMLVGEAAAPTGTNYEDLVLADNPIVYLKLNEASGTNANDQTGNNLDGTYTNTPTLGQASLLAGDTSNLCVSLDNTQSEYVIINDNDLLDIRDNFTIEIWTRPSVVDANWRCIVDKASADTYAGIQYGLQTNPQDKWEGFFVESSVASGVNSVVSTTAPSIARTDHLVFVRNGTTLKLYMNGVLDASASCSIGTVHVGTGNLAVGREGTVNGGYYGGKVQHFALYGYALSSDRINTHYQRGILSGDNPTPIPSTYSAAVLADNPILYQRLGESSGTTAFDDTSNNLDGTYQNTPTLGVTGALYSDSNTAVTLNGTNEYINRASATSLNVTSDFTIECWCKPTTLNSTWQTIVAKALSDTFTDRQYSLGITNVNRWRIAIYIGSTQYTANAILVLPDTSIWNHLVAVRSGTDLTLYVNNLNEVLTTGIVGSLNTSAGDFAIGRLGSADQEYGSVSVDEVAFYNYALSAERISDHYNLGYQFVTPPPPATGTGLWSQLGPGSSDVVWGARCGPDGTYWTTYDIGGIYRTSDQGTTWICCNNGILNYYGYDFAFHPTDYNRVWFAGRGGVFYSDDKGATWVRQGSGITNEAGLDSYPDTSGFTCVFSSIACAVSGGITYVFAGTGDKRTGGTSLTKWGRQGTIYRSSNGGTTWTNVLSIGNYVINELVVDPQDPNILYAATGYGIYRSTNALAATPTFTRVNTNSAQSIDAVVSGGTTYVWAIGWSTAGVYRFNGSSWSTVAASGLPNTNGYTIRGKPGSSSIAYASLGGSYTGSQCGVFRTTDSGATFVQITKWNTSQITYGWRGETGQTTMYGRTVNVDPTNYSRLFMGSSSQIYKTENAEAAESSVTWTYIYTKKELTTPNRWNHTGLSVMGAARSYEISSANTNIQLLGTGDHGLMLSGDGGTSWKVAFDMYHKPTGSGAATGVDCAAIACDPSNVNYIWACDGMVYSSGPGNAYLARSTDGGATWTEKSALRGRVDNILLDPDSSSGASRKMWVSFGSSIYYSTDGYSTESVLANPGGWVEKLIINPAPVGQTRRGYLYAATNGGGVYYSTNRGVSWTEIGSLSSAMDVSITSDGLTIYACDDSRTVGGIWKAVSTNGINFGAWSKIWPTGSMVAQTDYYNLAMKSILVSPSNDNVVYACAEGDDFNYDQSCGSGLWKTIDGGTTWNRYVVADGILVMRSFRLTHNGTNRVYCASNGAGVFVHNES